MNNNTVKGKGTKELIANETCGFCGSENVLNASQIEFQKPKVKNGKWLYVTSYSCVKCGKENVVQVDDVETRDMLAELKKLVFKQGKSAGLKVRYNRLQAKLKERREALMKEYLGKDVRDDD